MHLDVSCMTCSSKLRVESIKTPKSLGTGENSLPSGDNLKLLDALDNICLVPNTSNLVLPGFIRTLFEQNQAVTVLRSSHMVRSTSYSTTTGSTCYSTTSNCSTGNATTGCAISNFVVLPWGVRHQMV